MTGAITLAQLAAKTGMLEIRCDRCGRHGRQSVQNLISEYGADAGLPDLKEKLAKGCPKLKNSYDDRCGIHYPQFPTMF